MDIYDIAVIGGGAAGIMAAITSGRLKKKVVLIERNASVGKKILMTGKGRCNITNVAPVETFVKKFGKQGYFLRPAFFAFSNQDLIKFFKEVSLELKAERQGRVFPATNKARTVVDILKGLLIEAKVEVFYKGRLADIKRKEGFFELELKDKEKIRAKKVILATGGASYGVTGSTGDGFRLARRLGHAVTPLKAALVPLKTKETWVKDLQALALKNIRVTFKYGDKKVTSDIGEIIFTHFGVSGPLILDLSGKVSAFLLGYKEVKLFIDLKPALSPETVEERLLAELKENANRELKNIMKDLLPQKLIPVIIRLSGADAGKKGHQVTKEERHSMMNLLKALPLTVTGSLPLEKAMITGGGVSTKEIAPATMESKIVPGLYFAGEIIDGAAPSGGYNLQQAFSTGFLAGREAAKCVK